MLPSLQGVETTCSYQPNAAAIFAVCRALVERDWADASYWNAVGREALPFASGALNRMLGKVWDERLDRLVRFQFTITDSVGEDGPQVREAGKLVATIESETAGYLIIGPALHRLEQQHRGLGAAFYQLLQSALASWIRIYDHTDASYYEENLRDMMENDDPEHQEAYEFPKVSESIPGFLTGDEEPEVYASRSLLRRFLSSPCGDWIERLLRICQLSRLRVHHERVGDYYDDPPLPSLLVVFQQHDAIEASFDAEAQYFYEVTHEPVFAVPFSLNDESECDAAIRSVATFFRLNRELFELVEILNKWEESHAGIHQH